jgi:hypothetical protein
VARYVDLNPLRVARLGLSKQDQERQGTAAARDPGAQLVAERLRIEAVSATLSKPNDNGGRRQGRSAVFYGRLTGELAISGSTRKVNSRPRWTTKVTVIFRVCNGKVGKL